MLLGGRSARLASLGKTEGLHSGLLFPRLVIVYIGEPASLTNISAYVVPTGK